MATRSLNVVITGDAKSLNRAFGDVEKGATRVEGRMKGFSGSVTGAFAKIGPIAAAAGTAVVGAAAVMGKQFVETASDISESLTKNQVLFGKYAKDVEAWSRTTASSMGISRQAALEATGTFGNLFTALDIGPKKSADMSRSLVKLAADMASFNNSTPEEALEAIRSGLVGETEPLRRFGVNIQDATLRTEALRMGLIKTTKESLDPQTKALAANALIMRQTKSAHGDFERTSGGLANQQRILKARLADVSGELGAKLLPVALKVVTGVNNLVGSFSSGGKAAGEMRSKIAGAVDRIRTTVSAWVAKNRGDINSVVNAFKTIGRFAKEVFLDTALPIIKNYVQAAGQVIGGLVNVIRGLVRIVSGLLSGDWSKAWSGAKEVVSGAWKVIKASVVNLGKNLFEIVKDLGPKLVKGIGQGIANIGKALATGIYEGVKYAVQHVPGMVGGLLKGLGGKLIGALIPGGDGIGKRLAGAVGDGAGQIAGFAGGGSLMGAKSIMSPFVSIAGRFGLHTSSGLRPGAITSSGNPSYHGSGNAVDEAGTPAGMLGYFRFLKANFGSRLRELIYTPGGAGIKDGRPFTYTGQVASDHYDHVHVAFTGDGAGRGDGIGQAVAAARAAGFTGQSLINMVAIAGAESGYDADNKNFKYPDHSIGFWQINQLAHHGRFGTDAQLEDPFRNARAAKALYDASGYRPWSTWPAAARGWLEKARAAVASGGSSGSSGSIKGGKAKSGTSTATSGASFGGGYDPAAMYNDDGPEMRTARIRGLDGKMHTVQLPAGESTGLNPFPGKNSIKGLNPALVPQISTGSSEPAEPGEGPPTQLDYTLAALARASLTPETGDDLYQLNILRAIRGNELGAALADSDPRNDAAAVEAFKAVDQSIKDLQASIDANTNAVEEQRKQYEQLIAEDYRTKYNVSQSQYAILAQAVADAANGGIGQRLGISLAGLRAPAGSVARA